MLGSYLEESISLWWEADRVRFECTSAVRFFTMARSIFHKRHSAMALVAVVLVLLLQLHAAASKPHDLWPKFHDLVPRTETACDRESEIEALCQRCAKVTKAKVAYPMCCQNQEDAREWCDKYLRFGL